LAPGASSAPVSVSMSASECSRASLSNRWQIGQCRVRWRYPLAADRCARSRARVSCRRVDAAIRHLQKGDRATRALLSGYLGRAVPSRRRCRPGGVPRRTKESPGRWTRALFVKAERWCRGTRKARVRRRMRACSSTAVLTGFAASDCGSAAGAGSTLTGRRAGRRRYPRHAKGPRPCAGYGPRSSLRS